MGADVLIEGFDRAQVAQVMRWHQVDDEPAAWAALAEAERELRRVRVEQAERRRAQKEAEQSGGKTLGRAWSRNG